MDNKQYMNNGGQQAINPNDEQAFEQARRDEVENQIAKILDEIRRKHHVLSEEDKAFLRARQSYLTRADLEEYKEELMQADPLNSMTRKELEDTARESGIENPEDKKVYRTNQELIDAIKSA